MYIAGCLGVHVSLTVCTLQGALEFMYPSLCVHCRVPWSSCIPHCVYIAQGGHGTGKTGNLVLTFSRQGKHREFCFDTGKNSETQGKYFSVTQGKI